MTALLLHICCGPCATFPVRYLREKGYDLTGFWFNPNIQPGEEYQLRRESAIRYAEAVGLPLVDTAYEPERFEKAIGEGMVPALGTRDLSAGSTPRPRPERCRHCYRLRLEEAARLAGERGIGAFTTTLLISPYQDLDALRQIGNEVAGQHGVRFVYENLRRGWSERGRLARSYGLYLQQYCGCSYSLAERLAATGGKRP